MTRSISIALAALALVIAVGCNNKQAATSAVTNEQPAVAQANLSPEQLGELGAQIKNSPSDAQRLLTDRGLTEESFTAAVRKVAEDPSASKKYAEAYHKAGA